MADDLSKAQNVYAFARKTAIETRQKLDHEPLPRSDSSLIQALNDIHQDIESERRRITQVGFMIVCMMADRSNGTSAEAEQR